MPAMQDACKHAAADKSTITVQDVAGLQDMCCKHIFATIRREAWVDSHSRLCFCTIIGKRKRKCIASSCIHLNGRGLLGLLLTLHDQQSAFLGQPSDMSCHAASTHDLYAPHAQHLHAPTFIMNSCCKLSKQHNACSPD